VPHSLNGRVAATATEAFFAFGDELERPTGKPVLAAGVIRPRPAGSGQVLEERGAETRHRLEPVRCPKGQL